MLVCLSAAAIAQKAPPAKPFERFDGCVLKPDEWTDGDSFRVQLADGRFETFRLYPDLVVRNRNDEIYSVRYKAVNAMLLNEFLKEHKDVQEHGATIRRLEKQIEALTAGLQKVSAQRLT